MKKILTEYEKRTENAENVSVKSNPTFTKQMLWAVLTVELQHASQHIWRSTAATNCGAMTKRKKNLSLAFSYFVLLIVEFLSV